VGTDGDCRHEIRWPRAQGNTQRLHRASAPESVCPSTLFAVYGSIYRRPVEDPRPSEGLKSIELRHRLPLPERLQREEPIVLRDDVADGGNRFMECRKGHTFCCHSLFRGAMRPCPFRVLSKMLGAGIEPVKIGSNYVWSEMISITVADEP